MKIAMIEIHEWLAKGKVDARMIMQVHDEVILEVKDSRTFSNILSLKNVLLKNKEIHNPCGPSASLSPENC